MVTGLPTGRAGLEAHEHAGAHKEEVGDDREEERGHVGHGLVFTTGIRRATAAGHQTVTVGGSTGCISVGTSGVNTSADIVFQGCPGGGGTGTVGVGGALVFSRGVVAD